MRDRNGAAIGPMIYASRTANAARNLCGREPNTAWSTACLPVFLVAGMGVLAGNVHGALAEGLGCWAIWPRYRASTNTGDV